MLLKARQLIHQGTIFHGLVRSAELTLSRNAGHSHWQNIRHIKGAKDAIKSNITSQVAKRIRQAVRYPGGADPKKNDRLAKVVLFAEENNIPSKSIKSMIAKVQSSLGSNTQCKIEARGPSGSFLIFEADIADQVTKAKKDMNKHLMKCGGAVLSDGATASIFINKGIITAVPNEESSSQLTFADVEDVAISVEAEEVRQVGEDDDLAYEFICDPEQLHLVTKRLSEETKLVIDEHKIVPIPQVYVQLEQAEKDSLGMAIDTINEIYDCTVYDNIE